MITTTQVASDRAHDQTKTVLPTEIARGIYIENPPPAQALKLMLLLISQTGGRMADEVQHEMRLSDIKPIEGMRNHTRASLRTLFAQLAGAVMIYDDTEIQAEIIGGFMDEIRLDYRHEVSDDLMVKWWFGRTFRHMAAQSNHWAIIDRQTVFALSSKYSILLFQHITSLTGLKYVTSKNFTVPELRAVLGVKDGKTKRFADLNRNIIQHAIAEINQLARFTLTATPRKVGRTVASVEISWEEKPDLTEVKREQGKHTVGRKVRRSGSAELIVPPFPDCGGLSATAKIDQHWRGLFEENVSRAQGNHLPDSKQVCDAFRKARGDRLDGTDTERHFVNFCKRWQG